MAHGYIYAVSADALVRISLADRTVTKVATGLGAQLYERARVAVDETTCDVYFMHGGDISRVTARRVS